MSVHCRRSGRVGPVVKHLVGVLLPAAFSIGSAAPYTVQEERILLLHVDVLAVQRDRTETLASRTVEVFQEAGGSAQLGLPWPGADAPARLRLDASGTPAGDEGPHRLSIRTLLSVQGQRVYAGRTLEVDEGSTTLMDAFEDSGVRLVLAFRAETASRPVVVRGVTGPAVRFQLVIERVLGERFVPLETNRLQTFLGQSVEYSFQRGEGEAVESVRLRLRPLRIEGELAEVEVEISGSLPGEPNRLLLSRTDRVLSSRGATSPVIVATGQPASGYRFLITPEF